MNAHQTKKWPDLTQRRKRLRLKGFDYSNSNYVYFLTLCARHLTSPFQNDNLAKEVVESLFYLKREDDFPMYCYCLMPDHLHIVLSPSRKSGSVSKILQRYKSYTTQEGWKRGISGKLWQRSFYDHIARKNEDLVKICEYILANPVRKGLVDSIED